MSQLHLVHGHAPDDEPPAFAGPTPTAPAALAVMPERVRVAFERLTSCDGWSEAAWAVRSAVLADRRVDDRPEAWVEEELQVLEAVEQVKAWADLQGLRTVLRRTYVPRRHDYDDPLGRPVGASDVDWAVAAAAPDAFDDPPPY